MFSVLQENDCGHLKTCNMFYFFRAPDGRALAFICEKCAKEERRKYLTDEHNNIVILRLIIGDKK